MRALYGERRQILIDAITSRFGDALPVMGDEAGLHLVLGLPEGTNDRAVTSAAFEAGVIVRPLSTYYSQESAARPGLLLGYACVPHERIAPAFDALAGVIEQHLAAGAVRIA
jgi:GntR family transcriptional regulator/MocR family aminotransferase